MWGDPADRRLASGDRAGNRLRVGAERARAAAAREVRAATAIPWFQAPACSQLGGRFVAAVATPELAYLAVYQLGPDPIAVLTRDLGEGHANVRPC
jgi:hypothetical protein